MLIYIYHIYVIHVYVLDYELIYIYLILQYLILSLSQNIVIIFYSGKEMNILLLVWFILLLMQGDEEKNDPKFWSNRRFTVFHLTLFCYFYPISSITYQVI